MTRHLLATLTAVVAISLAIAGGLRWVRWPGEFIVTLLASDSKAEVVESPTAISTLTVIAITVTIGFWAAIVNLLLVVAHSVTTKIDERRSWARFHREGRLPPTRR